MSDLAWLKGVQWFGRLNGCGTRALEGRTVTLWRRGVIENHSRPVFGEQRVYCVADKVAVAVEVRLAATI